MHEVMTLLTSVSGHALVKSFSGTDVTHQPFSISKIFNVSEGGVPDLKSLSGLLHKLENGPAQTIIRGSLVEGKTGAAPCNRDTFAAAPHQCCMIDIDSLS